MSGELFRTVDGVAPPVFIALDAPMRKRCSGQYRPGRDHRCQGNRQKSAFQSTGETRNGNSVTRARRAWNAKAHTSGEPIDSSAAMSAGPKENWVPRLPRSTCAAPCSARTSSVPLTLVWSSSSPCHRPLCKTASSPLEAIRIHTDVRSSVEFAESYANQRLPLVLLSWSRYPACCRACPLQSPQPPGYRRTRIHAGEWV
jgi:hypothetical protein